MYKVGDRLVYIQGKYLIEIVDVKPYGFGGAQYIVKKVDGTSTRSRWISHKNINRLCARGRAAQLLYNLNVTKAVVNETDEV